MAPVELSEDDDVNFEVTATFREELTPNADLPVTPDTV